MMSRPYSMSGASSSGQAERRWKQLTFASCLCVVMLVPFWLFPSSSTHSGSITYDDGWSASSDASSPPDAATIEPPSYPPESERNIEDDPQALRKQFQQVHLSIHNNAEAYIDAIEKGRRVRVGASPQIGVTWVDHLADADPSSAGSGDGAPTDSGAAVQYGLATNTYSFGVSASSHTYSQGGWRGLIHDALLPDLRPSTRYYYRVGNSLSDEWSEEFHFTSPPLPPFLLSSSSASATSSSSSSIHTRGIDPSSLTSSSLASSFSSYFASSSMSSSFINAPAARGAVAEEAPSVQAPADVLATLAVFGDNGISHNAQKVINRIRDDPAIDAVVHVGDFAYSLQKGGQWTVDSELYGADKQMAWDMWFRMVEPLAAFKPYMAVPGNHETYKFDFHFVPYAHRFFMPGNSFWYWFDYSSIHFVSVSSDHNYTRGSEQYTWLDAHLTEFNRARNAWMRTHRRGRKAPESAEGSSPADDEAEKEWRSAWWLVALVHRNMYSSSVSQGSILQLRLELEPLFNKHGVDLVVHGHDHNYERTHPVVKARPHRVERSEGVYVKSCAEQMPPIYLRAGTGGIELGSLWDPQPPWSAAVYNEAYGYLRFTAYANSTLKTEFVSALDTQVKDTLILVKDPYVQCGRLNPYMSGSLSPWLLLFGVALAFGVACQARFCRRKRRRVFDMQHFFNANGGGYITGSGWSSS